MPGARRHGEAGLASSLAAGAIVIVIDMGSSEPMRSQVLAATLSECDVCFLDAPVSGGVKRATDGSLAIMVGGDEATFQRSLPLFQALGRTVTHVGRAGAGHAARALNNYVSAAGLVATAEALLIGQQFGLDPSVLTDS